jgi:hypothetical protein
MFWFSHSRPRKIMWGLFWILLGLFLLLSNHGLLGFSFSFGRDWPIILIAWGVMKILDLIARRNGRPDHLFEIIPGTCCHGGGEPEPKEKKAFRSEILQAVAEGRMSAEEAAQKLKGDR